MQTDKVWSTLTSLSQTKATSTSSSEMSSQITGTGLLYLMTGKERLHSTGKILAARMNYLGN